MFFYKIYISIHVREKKMSHNLLFVQGFHLSHEHRSHPKTDKIAHLGFTVYGLKAICKKQTNKGIVDSKKDYFALLLVLLKLL